MYDLEIRDVLPEEVSYAAALIREVFDVYVAPGFSDAGIATFLSYVEPETVLQRLAGPSFILTALLGGKIVGVVEVTESGHIALLFVDAAFHGRGIAKRLVAASLERLKIGNCIPEVLTVNSSLYAVPMYERMNFRPLGPQEQKDGMRFVRMARDLL